MRPTATRVVASWPLAVLGDSVRHFTPIRADCQPTVVRAFLFHIVSRR